MKKINAIIVDDEKNARELLASLLVMFNEKINLLESCKNLLDAVAAIKKYKPDVVFLDIEMPKHSGYEIVKFFEKIDFDIVFITAYDKYALKAFELSAIDYILKPVVLDRFQKTMDKLISNKERSVTIQQLELLTKSLNNQPLEKIVILENGTKYLVDIKDIVCIEAQRSYCKIFTSTNKTYLISKQLKHYEKLLKEKENFFRSHKSWLINTVFLEKYSKSNLEIQLSNNETAKLSRYKLEEFEALFKH